MHIWAYIRSLQFGRLVAIAIALPLCGLLLDFGFGSVAAAPFSAMLPQVAGRTAAVWIMLYGPFLCLLLWPATVVLAIANEGWRGLLVLPTAILVVPAGLLHLMLWGCAAHGACP